MQVKDLDILKAIILKEAETETLPQGFEEDPMGFILKKYPGLNEVMTYLMTKDFKEFVDAIFVVAPKPTTFKILLHNGQYFFLQFMGKTYQATVSGKNYYLMSIGEKERCMLAIARILRYGNPMKTKGPEGSEQGTRPEGEEGGAGGEAGAEVPEATPEAGGEELKESAILSEILKKNILEKEDFENSKKPKKDSEENKTEESGSEEYDKIISDVLGNDTSVDNKATLGTNFKLSGTDQEKWKNLYTKSPKTSKGEEESKGSGKGEIATYWLFKNSGSKVKDTRGGSAADLEINGIPCEIKSYSGKKGLNKAFKLGKYSSDAKTLNALNIVFGVDALTNSLRGSGSLREYNPANFNTKELKEACEKLLAFYNNQDLKKAAEDYNLDVIIDIYKKIEKLLNSLELKDEKINAESLAAKIITSMLKNKLSVKPGNGNYILNVSSDGGGEFYKIDLSKLDSMKAEEILDSVAVGQSEVAANFGKLFK
jgi:hypothetical protein